MSRLLCLVGIHDDTRAKGHTVSRYFMFVRCKRCGRLASRVRLP